MAEDGHKQKMQQKYMEISYMQQHLGQYKEQLDMLDAQLKEIDSIIEGLETIRGKDGKEILVPISNGIFAKATLKEADSLIVNVGTDIAVQKDTEGTKALLENQKLELQKAKTQITSIIETITDQMKMTEEELTKMMKK